MIVKILSRLRSCLEKLLHNAFCCHSSSCVQRISSPAHMLFQLSIADALAVSRVVTLRHQFGMFSALRQIPINSVVAHTQLASGEPHRESGGEIIAACIVLRPIPTEKLRCNFCSEVVAVLQWSLMHILISLRVDVGCENWRELRIGEIHTKLK